MLVHFPPLLTLSVQILVPATAELCKLSLSFLPFGLMKAVDPRGCSAKQIQLQEKRMGRSRFSFFWLNISILLQVLKQLVCTTKIPPVGIFIVVKIGTIN